MIADRGGTIAGICVSRRAVAGHKRARPISITPAPSATRLSRAYLNRFENSMRCPGMTLPIRDFHEQVAMTRTVSRDTTQNILYTMTA